MIPECFGANFVAVDLPFPCEVHYRMPMRLEANDNFKVLILHSEPSGLCVDHGTLRQIAHFFDLIITSNPQLYDLPNIEVAYFGDIWVRKLPSRKEFSTSFMFSLGANMPGLTGYDVRREFLQSADRVTMPKKFYRGKRPYELSQDLPLLIDDSKDCLFESMFHVAVENQSEPNYFSEKVIDCFSTFTVPIYYGCTNIGEFFDLDGMITANSADEMVQIVNTLTVRDYWQRMPAMQRNFDLAHNYWNWEARLRNVILQAWHKRRGTTLPVPTTAALDLNDFTCPGVSLIEIGTGTGQGVIQAVQARLPEIHSIDPTDAPDHPIHDTIRDEMQRMQSSSQIMLYKGYPPFALADVLKKSTKASFVIVFRPATYPLVETIAILRDYFKDQLRTPVLVFENLAALLPNTPGLTEAALKQIVLSISDQYEFTHYDNGCFAAIPRWRTLGAAYPAAKYR